MAVDWQKVGRGLSGFSAGVAGRGPEYLASLDARKKLLADNDEANRNKQVKRFSGSIQGAHGLINQGNMRGAIELLSSSNDKTLRAVGAELSNPETAQEAQFDIADFFNRGVANGDIKKPESTAAEQEFAAYQNLVARAERSGDPADAKLAFEFGKKINIGRESEQEKANIATKKAQDIARDKSKNTRLQGFVDTGVAMADATINIRRSVELLNSVKTGGFNAAQNRLGALFGVQGADPLELSSNMGRAFMQQLRPLFGSAFTVTEVNQLERISANFGKSTAGNLRLLKQSQKISERAAKRGKSAALELGDKFTADQITGALKYNLGGDEKKSDAESDVEKTATNQQRTIEVNY